MKTAIFAALFLAGCAWQPPAGKSQADFPADRYACEVETALQSDSLRQAQMFRQCMRLRGWQ